MSTGSGVRRDDSEVVESQNRTAIKVAWITSIAAVIGPIISGVASRQAGQASSTPAPTVTVTTTATAIAAGQAAEPAPTVTVTVTEPAPGGQQPAAPGQAVYLMDLTPSGDALGDGPQRLAGTTYKSLSFRTGCGGSDATTVYQLDKGYQRFQATVGLADAEDTTGVVEFGVYADKDGDGYADSDEQVGAKAASRGRPALIDVKLDGATAVILEIDAEPCYRSTAVWGDARVS